jgi:enamine deaminase RidA (YjgF/YER057c/UK114 family)
MIKHSIEVYPAFKIFITSLHDQLYLTASVTRHETDAERTAQEIYNRIGDLLSAASNQLILERCFGNIDFQTQLLEKRSFAFQKHHIDAKTPVTYVEGKSCLGNKFSGVQIRAMKSTPEARIRTIIDQGISKGRAWNIDGSTFFILHDIDGGQAVADVPMDRKMQSKRMFRQAEQILRTEGAAYQDVVRTWIYLSDILDWYDDFNVVRNNFYSENGILRNTDSEGQAEQIYLPASTGIKGKNPSGLPATMDVFAVHRSPGSSIHIRPIYGSKQRSPYRYGSAFSRAVVVEEPSRKMIMVSGTASIDEYGNSVFLDDPEAQIRNTMNVVSSLIAKEGATLQDICEATLFFKRSEDISFYQKVAEQIGIANLPSVSVVADVCRPELLFEIDAAFIIEKNKI